MITKNNFRYYPGDDVYITTDWKSGDGICVKSMKKYQGAVAKIIRVLSRNTDVWRDKYKLDVDNGEWNWEGFCFEPLCIEDDSCDIDIDESGFEELIRHVSL